MFGSVWFAFDSHRQECDEIGRVRVRYLKIGFADSHSLYTEFLRQFASNCVRVGLARFTLTAGKFPETAMTLVWRSLTDEQFITAANYGSNHTYWS